jgi:cell division protein FtsQ
LPLSNKFSARLPVFTNFPALNNSLTNTDSNLLTEIKNISLYISAHPFWMAQIEQVDITPERSFEMIPKIGNQVIVFGSTDNYEEKFDNLLIFYKNVQSKVGWNKYSKINVSYKNEVIAVKRDAAEVKMDSLKTIQLMKLLVANAQKDVNDSTGSIQLVQPKDDNTIPFARSSVDKAFGNQLFNHDDSISKYDSKAASPAIPKTSASAGAAYNDILEPQPPSNESHSSEKPISVHLKKQKLKPIIKKPEVVPEKQPKAVMPPKNDY